MRIYCQLNKDYIITSWFVPTQFTEHEAHDAELTVADDCHILVGYDKVVDGVLVSGQAEYEAAQTQLAETLSVMTQINEYKKLLADSDYRALKHADGALTDEEYAPIKEQRAAWRAEINRLEILLK